MLNKLTSLIGASNFLRLEVRTLLYSGAAFLVGLVTGVVMMLLIWIF